MFLLDSFPDVVEWHNAWNRSTQHTLKAFWASTHFCCCYVHSILLHFVFIVSKSTAKIVIFLVNLLIWNRYFNLNARGRLAPNSVSEPFLYFFGVKNAIFCKFLYLGFWYSRNYTYFYIPKWRYKAKSALKITNLHILNDLPNEWLYLLEC